jgi:hypothetical protein
MKAIGYKTLPPIEDPQSLLDIDVPTPVATGRDLLTEVRFSGRPDGSEYGILAWDAAGIVQATGPEAPSFIPRRHAINYRGAHTSIAKGVC